MYLNTSVQFSLRVTFVSARGPGCNFTASERLHPLPLAGGAYVLTELAHPVPNGVPLRPRPNQRHIRVSTRTPLGRCSVSWQVPAQWKVSSHVGTTRSGQRVLLLDITKGVVCKLNQVGSLVWLAISSNPGGNTAEGIATLLQSQFAHVARAQLAMDTNEFLNKLEQMRLVQRLP
jgi:hypothetical protein